MQGTKQVLLNIFYWIYHEKIGGRKNVNLIFFVIFGNPLSTDQMSMFSQHFIIL